MLRPCGWRCGIGTGARGATAAPLDPSPQPRSHPVPAHPVSVRLDHNSRVVISRQAEIKGCWPALGPGVARATSSAGPSISDGQLRAPERDPGADEGGCSGRPQRSARATASNPPPRRPPGCRHHAGNDHVGERHQAGQALTGVSGRERVGALGHLDGANVADITRRPLWQRRPPSPAAGPPGHCRRRGRRPGPAPAIGDGAMTAIRRPPCPGPAPARRHPPPPPSRRTVEPGALEGLEQHREVQRAGGRDDRPSGIPPSIRATTSAPIPQQRRRCSTASRGVHLGPAPCGRPPRYGPSGRQQRQHSGTNPDGAGSHRRPRSLTHRGGHELPGRHPVQPPQERQRRLQAPGAPQHQPGPTTPWPTPGRAAPEGSRPNTSASRSQRNGPRSDGYSRAARRTTSRPFNGSRCVSATCRDRPWASTPRRSPRCGWRRSVAHHASTVAAATAHPATADPGQKPRSRPTPDRPARSAGGRPQQCREKRPIPTGKTSRFGGPGSGGRSSSPPPAGGQQGVRPRSPAARETT